MQKSKVKIIIIKKCKREKRKISIHDLLNRIFFYLFYFFYFRFNQSSMNRTIQKKTEKDLSFGSLLTKIISFSLLVSSVLPELHKKQNTIQIRI